MVLMVWLSQSDSLVCQNVKLVAQFLKCLFAEIKILTNKPLPILENVILLSTRI